MHYMREFIINVLTSDLLNNYDRVNFSSFYNHGKNSYHDYKYIHLSVHTA